MKTTIPIRHYGSQLFAIQVLDKRCSYCIFFTFQFEVLPNLSDFFSSSVPCSPPVSRLHSSCPSPIFYHSPIFCHVGGAQCTLKSVVDFFLSTVFVDEK